MGRRERQMDLLVDLGQLLRRLNTLGERADRIRRTDVADDLLAAALSIGNALLKLEDARPQLPKGASASERYHGLEDVPF